MKILYCIVTLILLILFILVKKTEKKQNVMFWIVITATILISYQVILSYILTLIGLKCTLLNFMICNIIISSILLFKIRKDKEIQKYDIKMIDIVFMIVLLVVVITIAYQQYGFPLEIKYETTDPGVHFQAAKDFYEQKVLLFKGKATSYYGYETFMPTAYVNTGILFELFSDIIDQIDMYKIYILFDLILLYLMGAVFYFALINNETRKIKKIIAMILSIICILGYPLNSMLFGFAYLSVGLLMIIGILAMAKFVKQKDINVSIISIVLFLLMFGLFFSYYLFVPVVYSALGLYILIDIIKNRKETKIFSKTNIIKVIVILILPTILGFIYFVLPGLISTGETSISHMGSEGYIYRDLYINFIPFAPFMLYYIIDMIRNKKNSFSMIVTTLLLAFVAITFVGGMKGRVSSYYYFKSYYYLWILAIYLTYRVLCKMIENKELSIFAYTYIFVYVMMMVIVYGRIDQEITSRNVLFNPSNKAASVLDIQTINGIYTMREEILNKEQIEGVKELNQYINQTKKNDVIVYGDMLERIWIYVLTGITDSNSLNALYECPIHSIEEFLESDKKYLFCVMNDKSNTEINISTDSDKYFIVFENENSVLLEKI